VSVVGTGGLIASIIAFLKVKQEKDSIIVTSAEKTVEAQTKVNRNLLLEIDRLNLIIDEQRAQLDALYNQANITAEVIKKQLQD
jgi:threonine dehydratase